MDNTSTKSGLYKLLSIFFTLAGRDIDEDLLYEIVTSHENPDSLLCLSDTLMDFDINTITIRSDSKKIRALTSLSFLHMFIDSDKTAADFFLLENITEETVTFIDSRNKRLNLPINTFEERWSGIVVVTEIIKPDASPGSFVRSLVQKSKSWIFLLAIMACIGFTYSAATPKFIPAILLLKLCGCVISWLLVQKSLNVHNSFSDAICSFAKKLDCDKVLHSTAAKFLGIHISELALFYFSVSFFSLLIITLLGNPAFFLDASRISSYLTLGCIVYTIFYQSVILKSWCSLCLLLSAFVLAEAILFFVYARPSANVDMPSIFIVILSGSLILAATTILKSLYMRLFLYKKGYSELSRLKKKREVLLAIMQYKKIENNAVTDTDIILGNETAENTLIEIINPFCNPCNRHLTNMLPLLLNAGFKLVIRFSGIPLDTENLRYKTTAHLLALYRELPRPIFIEAMLKWYETKNYDELIRLYPLQNQHPGIHDIVESQIRWSRQEGIRYTPAVVFNGYQCPTWLNMNDLKYYLENFLEQ